MSELLETDIGTVAPDWTVDTLDNVCEPPRYGYTASAETKGNTRFLRITDITDSGVKWDSVPFCECPVEDLEKYRLKTGDIVFARIGATTGKSYLITNPPHAVFASYLIRVRCKAQIDAAFLSNFFRSDAYWRQIDSQKGTSLKMGVNGSILKTLRVPVPPFPEQRKIAGVLGLVQRAMEQQERLIEKTAELKKTLLHQLFTQGLENDPEIFVPDALVKFKVERSIQLPSAQIKNEGRWPVVDQGQAFVSGYTDEDAKVLKTGLPLIIFGDHTRCLKFVDFPFVLGADGTKVLRADERRFRPKFLYYALSSLDIPNRGYNRHFTVLKERRVKQPPLEIQDTIVEQLSTLDSKLAHHRRKHATLSALFRTLLHQLMTAQLRVHDLDLDGILSQPVREIQTP